MNHTIHFTVNGEPFTLAVESHHTLLQVLREQLDRKSTRLNSSH